MPVSTAFDYGPINGTVQAGLGVPRQAESLPHQPIRGVAWYCSLPIVQIALQCLLRLAISLCDSPPTQLNNDPRLPFTTQVCRCVGSAYRTMRWRSPLATASDLEWTCSFS